LFHQGEFSRSIERGEDGVNLYDPQHYVGLAATYGENPAVACHGWAALSLWCLGYPDKALERVQRSLELAGHPDLIFSQAGAKVRAAHVYQLRRDPVQTLHWATAAVVLAEEHGYLYASSFARALKGWAISMSGHPADGVVLMQEGIALLNHIGANMDRPYLLALLSEIHAANRQVPEALGLVGEALGQVRGSRAYFYEAELYRLRGVLILRAGGRAEQDEAEANFRQALGIAKQQKARALELRAAVSLYRLLHTRGMPQDGLRTLAPIYRWFKEGSATSDLIEAKELLAAKVDTPQTLHD
jgi:predicted ATPase